MFDRDAAGAEHAALSDKPGQSQSLDAVRRPLYPVSRLHLAAISDRIGIWQHARGCEPDRRFGYCTDDVARAIVVDVLQSREIGWPAVDASVGRSIKFLEGAFDRSSGRFLNLRDADGDWLEADASEDCHARALGALAAVMAEVPGTDLADDARILKCAALPAAMSFGAMRAVSAASMACRVAAEAGVADEAGPAFDLLAARLVDLFGDPTAEWPWPDPILTYENALVPQALITAGLCLGRPALLAKGCSVLDWLIEVQTGEAGQFSPIGNKGWWPQGGQRSRFDQQPIEAATMVSAAAVAFRATGRRRYLDAAESAYGWFLGDNDVGVVLADPANGSCHDGLTEAGPNANHGAESTLMWLTALEMMREVRRSARRDTEHRAFADPRLDREPRQ